MTDAVPSGVVVDTMVVSWLFDDRSNPLADPYAALIGPRPVVLAFQTAMELRFGARRAGWGEFRRRRLERRIAEMAVVQPDDAMITVCAELRARCLEIGHALGDKVHTGDAWIASSALRLGLPLVTHDGVFVDAPGLHLITTLPEP